MRPILYSTVYNKLYSAPRGRVGATITRHLQSRCAITRRRWAAHLYTIHCTQTLGHAFDCHTLDEIATTRRLCELETLQHLRRLQRAVASWLWRPDGALAHRCAERWVTILGFSGEHGMRSGSAGPRSEEDAQLE